MIGAIIGDISGSRFERRNHKSKEFEFFDKRCRPTDDSIMSLAIAKAILDSESNYELLSEHAITSMQEFGRKYKNAGYGGSFIEWLRSDDPQPYNSFGNGAAMRISPCGFAAKSLEEAKTLSKAVTEVTHNHEEGLKGAEAVAVAIFLAKEGKTKEEIKTYIQENYYELGFTIDAIRDSYKFDVSCQGSVPVAIEAFFESSDFEDAIRTAISVGGDSDTIAAITASIAEAFYGIPEGIIDSAIDFLDGRQMEILYYFEKKYPSKALDLDGEATGTVFDCLDYAVDKVIPAGTEITVDGDPTEAVVHGWVDPEAMIPDFSSFDKADPGEEAIEFLEKTGAEISRTAKKAGAGILSAAKYVKANIDAAKQKASENAEHWYEIISDSKEDTEKIMLAVDRLKKSKFNTAVRVLMGEMHGYVLLKEKELENAKEHLMMPDGAVLELSPVDKRMSEMLKKRAK